jgi:UPF0716 protein FxsA
MALILLVVLFIGLPLLEIAVFIEVGGIIGVWATIGLIIATTVAGSLLLRAQGLATLTRARAQMDAGHLPAREIFDGFCVVLAAGLLVLPGFVTDALGLLLFLPPVRDLLRLMITRRIAAKAARGEARIFVDGIEVGRRRGRSGKVIEGEYEDITEEDDTGEPPPDRRRLGR